MRSRWKKKMAPGAARLCLLLLVLQLGCATPLVVQSDAGTTAGQRRLDVPRAEAAPPHKKAPQFMLDFFNAVTAAEGTPKSQTEILEGNTVRSFEDKGHNREGFHVFNLSSFSREEKIIKAEFRWFRKKQKQKFYLGNSHGPHFYKVNLYEVLDSRVKPWRGNLITSRLVPLHTQGWEVFNITDMVSKWILNSQENGAILVTTTFLSGNWMEAAVSSTKRDGRSTDKNAYLVIFSDDGRAGANKSGQGQPEPQERLNRRRRASSAFPPRNRPQTCQRVPLFVDFDEIGWSGWIISPRGYNAYHCKGSCPFPLGVGLRATNHATVRSIMHALKLSRDQVEAPCCVPDRLQSISLLYFDDEENVVLKQYDDMVALSCGCH